jgi:hypothetical protein
LKINFNISILAISGMRIIIDIIVPSQTDYSYANITPSWLSIWDTK